MTMIRPRVVLFRHVPYDFDSRAKRIAGTLNRSGFEPIIISFEAIDGPARDEVFDEGIRVIRIPVAFLRSQPVPVPPPDVRGEWLDRTKRQQAELRKRINGPTPRAVKSALRWARLTASRLGQRALWWMADRKEREATAPPTLDLFDGLDLLKDLPVAYHVDFSLRDLLVSLRPDVLHPHNPYVLVAAWRAAQELRRLGHPVSLSYDVREVFEGIPEKEISNRVVHDTMVEVQRRFMPSADLVMTVSEEIAEHLTETYSLRKPALGVRNYPLLETPSGTRTVRTAAGLESDTPLIVYSGVITKARGVETLVEAMAHVPGDVHLAIVTMPLPHPFVPELVELATTLGIQSRIHFLPAVDQTELLYYLSGADIAVHPMPGGSPNHDRAMPNKLFEYLHAGLTLVCSDARTIASFVRDNGIGRVFRSEDPSDLAAQLTAALAEPVPAEHLRSLARRYSWQHNEPMLAEAFRAAVGAAHADPEPSAAPAARALTDWAPPGSLSEAPLVVLVGGTGHRVEARRTKMAETLAAAGYPTTLLASPDELGTVLHARQPAVVLVAAPTVWRVIKGLPEDVRATLTLIYDANTFWAGLRPPHWTDGLGQLVELLEYERALLQEADGVIAVTDDLADRFKLALRLPRRPLVLPDLPGTEERQAPHAWATTSWRLVELVDRLTGYASQA